MNIDEAANLTNKGWLDIFSICNINLNFFLSDIASYLKLPPVKLHCSMLAEDAIKKAIEDFKKKNEKDQSSSYTLWKPAIEFIFMYFGLYLIYFVK